MEELLEGEEVNKDGIRCCDCVCGRESVCVTKMGVALQDRVGVA